MPKKLTIDYIRARALEVGFTLLSDVYVNNKQKLEWLCSKGHLVYKKFNSIDQNDGCSICSGTAPLNIDIAQREAAARGGKCLSTEYINSMSKLQWECKAGHHFAMTIGHVKNSGAWCRYCAFETHRVPWSRYESLCLARGGYLLADKSTIPHSTQEVPIRCGLGHVFERSFTYLREGHWCPECHRTRPKTNAKAQIELYNYVLLKYPDALYNKSGMLKSKMLELDIYIPSLKKAIELDGEYWHSKPEAIERDARKNEECREAGIKLLRLTYKKHWAKKKADTIGKKMVLDFLTVPR